MTVACADFSAPIAPIASANDVGFTTVLTVPAARTVDRIYLADTLGGNVVRLTTGRSPAWSPDGSRIVFERDGTIILIDLGTRRETVLRHGQWPAWSPDGAKIAFTSGEGISVMNIDGTDVRMLVPHRFREDTYESSDIGVGKPAWSPDGRSIAFEHMGDDVLPAQVYVMSLDGSPPRRLSAAYTGYWFAESDPAWSPDGTRIAFWSYGLGIAVARLADNSRITVFASFPYVAYGAHPAWSPDGRYIAFNTYPHAEPMRSDLLLARATGGSVRTLIRDAYGAAWSPNGSQIAFVSRRPAKGK